MHQRSLAGESRPDRELTTRDQILEVPFDLAGQPSCLRRGEHSATVAALPGLTMVVAIPPQPEQTRRLADRLVLPVLNRETASLTVLLSGS